MSILIVVPVVLLDNLTVSSLKKATFNILPGAVGVLIAL